jgi:epoxyqueuosine reductase QueG
MTQSPDIALDEAAVELESFVKERGIPVFGIADLTEYPTEVRYVPKEAVSGLNRGIVLGYRVSDRVIESLDDGPTSTYRYHYRQANLYLDSAATAVVSWLQERGYSAFPIPSSQIIDWRENKGHVWHVAVACLSGVAWWGRNNLAVTEAYGSRVRYATVLTDMPLPAGSPSTRDCGDCFDCVGSCPVGAIRNSPEEFDLETCHDLLKKFSKGLSLGVKICGLCIKACRGSESWRPDPPK